MTHLQQLLFELLHLGQVELTEQVWDEAGSVVPVHLSQPRPIVEVTVAAVAVLHVAVSSGADADVGAVGSVGLLGELEPLDAGDGEGQVGPGSVDAVAQAEVVGQFFPQVVLLLALSLQGVQRFLQLTLGDFLQAQCVFQLAVEEDGLLLQHLDFMFQSLVLHLGKDRGEILFLCFTSEFLTRIM